MIRVRIVAIERVDNFQSVGNVLNISGQVCHKGRHNFIEEGCCCVLNFRRVL